MPRLAIVISAAGSVEALEATLVSVLENRPAGCEVLVALTRPYADPYDLKDEVRFLPPARRANAVSALNTAIARAQSPIVHVLAAGCLVREGWTEAAVSQFSDNRLASVVPWVWNAEDPTRLLATGIGYHRSGRRHLIGLDQGEGFEPPATVIGPALFAAFYRKSVLEFLGGFSPKLTLRQADADLVLAMRRAGLKTAVVRGAGILAPDNIDARRGAWAEALSEERLFWRNLERVSLGTLLSHAMHAAWDSLRELPSPSAVLRLAGRGWANLEWRSHARRRRQLTEVAAHTTPAATSAPGNLRIDTSHPSHARTDATQSARMRTG